MRKCLIAALAGALSFAAFAGSFIVSVKMPDGSVMTFEYASIPKADENGMYRFHNKHGGDIIVHASNVWIEEKCNKSGSKTKK